MIRSTSYAYNFDPLSRFLQKARRQRCVIISIENSNGYQNTGSAGGRVRAQRNAFAAAGLVAWGTHITTISGALGVDGTSTYTGLAPSFDDHSREGPSTAASNWCTAASIGSLNDIAGVSVVHNWGRSPDKNHLTPWNSTMLGLYSLGTAGVATTAASCNGGLNLFPTAVSGLIDWSAALKGHFWYSTVTPTGGTLRPLVRRHTSNTILATPAGDVTVAAGTPTLTSMDCITLDVAAGSRGADTYMTFRFAGGYAPTGSNYLSYVFVEQADREYGLAYGLYWAVGGTSPMDFMWATTDGNLAETYTISEISTAAAPVVTVTSAHGFTDLASTDNELVLITNTNSTPTINGFWGIEVTSTTAFSIQSAIGVGSQTVPTTTVAGTSGTVTRFVRPLSIHAMIHQNHALMYPIVDKGQEPCACVRVCDTLNSQNETGTSINYGDTADSAEAYKVALRSIIGTVVNAWSRTRFTDSEDNDVSTKLENLCIWLDPDHPPAATNAEIDTYIAAAKEVTAEFPDLLTVTDTSKLVTYAELLAGTGGGGSNSYYQASGTDTNHLTKAGYEFVEGRKVAALMTLPPPAYGGSAKLRGRY